MKVMRYKEYNPKKVVYPCLVSIKQNGVWGRRAKLVNNIDNPWVSRQGKSLIGLSHLDEELKTSTTLDGELVVPGKTFEETNGLTRNHKEEPDTMFYIFDIPMVNKTFAERYDIMLRSSKLNGLEHVRVVTHWYITNEEQLDQFYGLTVSQGHEGIVICDPNAYYTHGRSYARMKRCPVLRAEVKILKAYEGKGKMQGMLGGFLCEYDGPQGIRQVRVGIATSETEKWSYPRRKELWIKQNEYIGRMMKVAYKSPTNKGSLQQPRCEAFL